MLALAWALASITGCSSSASAISSERYSAATLDGRFERCNQYAPLIRGFSERYLPWDWHWLAAQVYQESVCDPDAVSSAGAMGLGQFMPGTWSDVSRALGWRNVSPFSPKPNLHATALYMSGRRDVWNRRGRTEAQIRPLAQASYNAGTGNILRAQRVCGDAAYWENIAPCLHKVTGRHSEETKTYVQRIRRWFLEMT